MIKTYTDRNKSNSNPKPGAISSTFFENGVSGFSMDFYYGPYGTPDGGVLNYNYYKSGQGNVTRPNVTDDGQPGEGGTWNNNNGTAVYNSILDYQKSLAKQLLDDVKQFFVGKKVAFINEDGTKAVEYVVVDDGNGNKYFEESGISFDLYTITFASLEAEGAQMPVESVSKYYTLPKSNFTPPTVTSNGINMPKLFAGWQLGYRVDETSTNLYLDVDSDGNDVLYDVNTVADIGQWCEDHKNDGVTKDNVTFYARYKFPDQVMVDFENGYYDNDEFKSIDGDSSVYTGYVQVQSGSYGDSNTKPKDWDSAHSSYFTKVQNENEDMCHYAQVTWQKVWSWRGKTAASTSYEWNATNAQTFFPRTDFEHNEFESNPSQQTGLIYVQGHSMQFVYTPSLIDETGMDEKQKVQHRTWYQLYESGYEQKYVACGSDYENNYKTEDLYAHIIRDSFATFNNGEVLGNLNYDCTDETIMKSYQGCAVQLNTNIIEPYNKKFAFDHWEIIPFKLNPVTVVDTSLSSKTQIPHNETYNSVNPIFRLNATYTQQSDDDNQNYVLSPDVYIFRAVYKKRDDYYAKLYIENNYLENLSGNLSCPTGTIEVYATFLDKRGQTTTRRIGTIQRAGLADTAGFMEENIQGLADGSVEVLTDNDSNKKYLSLDPNFILSVKLKAIPSDDGFGTAVFYAWTENWSENKIYTTNTVIDNIDINYGGVYQYKAWFVWPNDVKATVKVCKRFANPSLLNRWNGSGVDILGYKIQNPFTAVEVNGDEPIPGFEYLYEIGTKTDTIPTEAVGNSRGGDQGIGGHKKPLSSVVPTFSTSTVSITNTAEANIQQLPSQWTVVPDDENGLDNPAEINITKGHGYCFARAWTGKYEDSAQFLCWEDGDTNPIRLVDVTVPTEYRLTAIFKCLSDTSAQTIEQVICNHENLTVLQPSGISQHGGNSIQVTDDVASSFAGNMLQINHNGMHVYVKVPFIEHHEDLNSSDEYNEINNIVNSYGRENPPTPTVSTKKYDELGNKYETFQIIGLKLN